MLWMEEDKMPHVELFTHGKLNKENITRAYKELSTSFHGISDIVVMLDGIFEGAFSLSEITIAGIILDKALDGYYMQKDKIQKAKYIRINGSDMVLLSDELKLLTNSDFCKSEFDGNNGTRYKLQKKRVGKK